MNNDNNLKRNNEIKSSSLRKFKPIKRPFDESHNPLVKMLDTIVSRLEQTMGKHTYLCGNPGCGTLIIFHSDDPRPVVCLRCGTEIDWEGEYITRIKVCPKCNKEYESNSNFCSLHLPALALIEKEVEK